MSAETDKLAFADYIHGGTQKDFYQESDRENCNCPLCDGNAYEKLYTERGLSVVRCNSCELIYTNPRARSAEQNYFGEADVFFEEARLIFKGKKVHHRDRNYEYELRKIKQVKSKGKLLDVGTNMGFFLRKAREFGFETEGVEPSPSLAKIATEQWGLKIHNGFLQDVNLPSKSYDIITLIDVFEHVTEPKELLQKCHQLLKDDGIAVIKVPNGDYNHTKQKLAAMSGKASVMDIWDCYEHVVFYTPTTFAKMAASCGFKVDKTIIPLPIHSPIWQNLVGHCYQYPSPFYLDWKRILLRNLFYYIGKIENLFSKKVRFGPDLMFVISKSSK